MYDLLKELMYSCDKLLKKYKLNYLHCTTQYDMYIQKDKTHGIRLFVDYMLHYIFSCLCVCVF